MDLTSIYWAVGMGLAFIPCRDDFLGAFFRNTRTAGDILLFFFLTRGGLFKSYIFSNSSIYSLT